MVEGERLGHPGIARLCKAAGFCVGFQLPWRGLQFANMQGLGWQVHPFILGLGFRVSGLWASGNLQTHRTPNSRPAGTHGLERVYEPKP